MNKQDTRQDVMNYRQEVLEQIMLVSPADAARVLDCSERAVMNLIREGELHAYCRNTRSRGVRLLARELREYVNSIKLEKDAWRE